MMCVDMVCTFLGTNTRRGADMSCSAGMSCFLVWNMGRSGARINERSRIATIGTLRADRDCNLPNSPYVEICSVRSRRRAG